MELLREELRGWKRWELIWLGFCIAVIIGISLWIGDTLIGIICAVAGVTNVVCTGKGKLMSYLFGLINVILYAIISYNAKYYGEVMLNVLYYLPMQFYGFFTWKKNMNTETHEVKKLKMTAKGRIILTVIIAVMTVVYGIILHLLGGNMPFVDAFSTVASVVALYIAIKMYIEQWMIWLVVDIVTVIMWAFAFASGTDSIATLVMWALYIANAVVMHVKWSKEIKKRKI
ncbi:MAG: nicotinamide mononucleotide transporter [Ruminiclostridium sp.]|nr:nicotinamide mononucleotide transporter [Ruminiclostridium sp.]